MATTQALLACMHGSLLILLHALPMHPLSYQTLSLALMFPFYTLLSWLLLVFLKFLAPYCTLEQHSVSDSKRATSGANGRNIDQHSMHVGKKVFVTKGLMGLICLSPTSYPGLFHSREKIYIDMSVLPKNIELVFFIQNYIRDTSEIFSISSLVRISLTSFLCFSFVFRLVFFYFRNTHIYALRSLVKSFFPLEDKLHSMFTHRVISSMYYAPRQSSIA